MFYVYILKSNKDTHYTGFTNDLKRRLHQHNNGNNFSTKGQSWELVYYEAYLNKHDAMNREKKLKQDGRSKYHLFNRIKNCLKK